MKEYLIKSHIDNELDLYEKIEFAEIVYKKSILRRSSTKFGAPRDM